MKAFFWSLMVLVSLATVPGYAESNPVFECYRYIYHPENGARQIGGELARAVTDLNGTVYKTAVAGTDKVAMQYALSWRWQGIIGTLGNNALLATLAGLTQVCGDIAKSLNAKGQQNNVCEQEVTCYALFPTGSQVASLLAGEFSPGDQVTFSGMLPYTRTCHR